MSWAYWAPKSTTRMGRKSLLTLADCTIARLCRSQANNSPSDGALPHQGLGSSLGKRPPFPAAELPQRSGCPTAPDSVIVQMAPSRYVAGGSLTGQSVASAHSVSSCLGKWVSQYSCGPVGCGPFPGVATT